MVRSDDRLLEAGCFDLPDTPDYETDQMRNDLGT